MTKSELDEARAAIASLLKAASNPQLSDAQTKLLLKEARLNAQMAFSERAGEELTLLAIAQVTEFYESSVVALKELAQANGVELSMQPDT